MVFKDSSNPNCFMICWCSGKKEHAPEPAAPCGADHGDVPGQSCSQPSVSRGAQNTHPQHVRYSPATASFLLRLYNLSIPPRGNALRTQTLVKWLHASAKENLVFNSWCSDLKHCICDLLGCCLYAVGRINWSSDQRSSPKAVLPYFIEIRRAVFNQSQPLFYSSH